MQEHLKLYEDKMEKSLDVLLDEYASIRAGRANPHVLDRLRIDYYGTPTPIQQVGNVKKKGEGAKVAIRNIRRDAMDSIKKMEKAGDISEDDLKQGEEKIQKITDKMIEKVDKAIETKTKEIMSV